MSEDNGGAAFPWCGDLNDCPCINLGMTLRDYFAAQVLPEIASRLWSRSNDQKTIDGAIASACYSISDAMLEERNG